MLRYILYFVYLFILARFVVICAISSFTHYFRCRNIVFSCLPDKNFLCFCSYLTHVVSPRFFFLVTLIFIAVYLQIKKNHNICHISVQNIDCGYSLELPHRGGSNEYPQSMFLSRNKKNNVYPCKPQFYYIKVRFKGVKIL